MKLMDSVTEELEIAAPIDRVYAALVTADELAQWWGSSDSYRTTWEMDLRVGGEYLCRAHAGDMEMTVHGRFLAIEPPGRLSYTWNASWDPSGETRVDYELTPIGAATRVRVTQSGFAPEADRAGYQEGWSRILGWLSAFVSG
jgi:uncharacterized protein YndB with AHSA1/START domain